jgi:hypothetical protein
MEILTKIINQISDDDSGTVGYAAASATHRLLVRRKSIVCLFVPLIPTVRYAYDASGTAPRLSAARAAARTHALAHTHASTRIQARAHFSAFVALRHGRSSTRGSRAPRARALRRSFDELKAIIVHQQWKESPPTPSPAAQARARVHARGVRDGRAQG